MFSNILYPHGIIIKQMVEDFAQILLADILLKLRTFFGTGKRKMQIEHLKNRGPKGLGLSFAVHECFFWDEDSFNPIRKKKCRIWKCLTH